MTTAADLDCLAQELNLPRAPHSPGCGRPVSTADELRRHCPHCHHLMVQGIAASMSADRAADMLIELGAVSSWDCRPAAGRQRAQPDVGCMAPL